MKLSTKLASMGFVATACGFTAMLRSTSLKGMALSASLFGAGLGLIATTMIINRSLLRTKNALASLIGNERVARQIQAKHGLQINFTERTINLTDGSEKISLLETIIDGDSFVNNSQIVDALARDNSPGI